MTVSLADFEATGALLTGHFQLSSGLHSDRYLQCARLLMWPARAESAGRELAQKLSDLAPDLVVSPALGGLLIGHETARALGKRFLFVERVDGSFALRRGFAIEPGERVVLVEDVFTTGRSTRETAAAVEAAGGKVVGAGSIVSRSLPADTVFRRAVDGEFDVVIGMYHDQALTPLKLLDFDRAVNVTLGLPIVRTSVDHGTAYDLAGKGVASAGSMIAAMLLAASMVRERRRGEEPARRPSDSRA